MKRKKLLSALIVIFAFGVAYPVIAPAQASAYLYVTEAEIKAEKNTWNVFCHASSFSCQYYPSAIDHRRVDSKNVKVTISVHKRNSGWCRSQRHVREYSDGSTKVVENLSGLYYCS